MRFIGNLLWFLVAGLWLSLGWLLAGLFWCITIVGIPWGLQCFKFAKLTAAPFGKDVIIGEIGCAIGAHTGPGVLGIVCATAYDERFEEYLDK